MSNWEIDRTSFFKRFSKVLFLRVLGEDILPTSWVSKIARKVKKMTAGKHRAEGTSRNDYWREHFRKTARAVAEGTGADIIILGHSHVKDLYVEGFTYAKLRVSSQN